MSIQQQCWDIFLCVSNVLKIFCDRFYIEFDEMHGYYSVEHMHGKPTESDANVNNDDRNVENGSLSSNIRLTKSYILLSGNRLFTLYKGRVMIQHPTRLKSWLFLTRNHRLITTGYVFSDLNNFILSIYQNSCLSRSRTITMNSWHLKSSTSGTFVEHLI